ncbi:MAG TPA: LysM domain-containing protein, partial [bacterium]
MAQKPSPAPKKPPAAKPAPAPKPKKASGGGMRALLLWGGIGLAALLLGLAVAWYFLVAPSKDGGPLRVVKDFLPSTKKGAAASNAQPGLIDNAEHTHTVKAGENLWSIAKQGGLVTNPWEWRTILVQNRDKISYAFISEDDGAWKVMV